jgi:hypothetical protein
MNDCYHAELQGYIAGALPLEADRPDADMFSSTMHCPSHLYISLTVTKCLDTNYVALCAKSNI